MKKITYLTYLIIFLIFQTSNFTLYAVNHSNNTESKHECHSFANGLTEANSQQVFICTGQYAYAYHSSATCPGLNNCKGEIKSTDEYSALNSYGRRPCCRCWTNISGNCKDDNPYNAGTSGGGSADNSEAYVYVALAIAATGAIILSNDFYVYPTYSFYKGLNNNSSLNPEISNGTGLSFGFRKTFKHSALEYGASYLKFITKNPFLYNDTYEYYSNENSRWGYHFNFVQQLFYFKTPYWLKVYCGPSVNYVSDIGYGGIFGTEFSLFDRLKFDIRYEYTTQTNQIQAGFIFTYQRRYFWNK